MRVDPELPAQIGCDLAGLPVGGLKVGPVVHAVLADLKLNPAGVAGTLGAGTAAPGTVIPRHGLDGGHRAVGQLANPAVHPRLPVDMVPVVVILVLAQQLQPVVPICRVVAGLDVPLEIRVVRPGIMPEDALDLHLAGALVAGALGLHAHQRLVVLVILHGFLLPPAHISGKWA